MKIFKNVSIIFFTMICLFISGCNSSSSGSSDSGDGNEGSETSSEMTQEQKKVAGYAVESANASTEIAINSSNSAYGQAQSQPQSLKKRTPQATYSNELDLLLDTDGDGYDDLSLVGSFDTQFGVSPALTFTNEITGEYIKDAILQGEENIYTIKENSSLSQEGVVYLLSQQSSSMTGNADNTLSNFKMEWTENSSSISTDTSGTLNLTYEGNIDYQAKTFSATGTTAMDMTTTVTIDGESHEVKINGSGQFSLSNTGFSPDGTYTITIDGVTFQQYSFDELN